MDNARNVSEWLVCSSLPAKWTKRSLGFGACARSLQRGSQIVVNGSLPSVSLQASNSASISVRAVCCKCLSGGVCMCAFSSLHRPSAPKQRGENTFVFEHRRSLALHVCVCVCVSVSMTVSVSVSAYLYFRSCISVLRGEPPVALVEGFHRPPSLSKGDP